MNIRRLLTNKIFLTFIGSCVFIFALARLYYNLTDDFRIANITHDLPYQTNWELPPLTSDESDQLHQILSQKFTYLAKGAQSYVFLSEDGNYVLKFFKFKHLRPSHFFSTLASLGLFKGYHQKLAARKERKLWGVFNAHKLAYDQDKDLSGLLYIQLNITGNPENYVTVQDKIGIERHINLQNTTFIIQKRGEPLRDVLKSSLKSGDIDSALIKIGKIFDLYAVEYSRGFYDHDHGVMRNIGFAGDEPLHLDVGKLLADESFKDKKRAKEDVLLVAAQIQLWVDRNYPIYTQTVSDFIQKKITDLFE